MRDRFKQLVARLGLRREEGQTTVEYAIVVALVVAMAVAVFGTLSSSVSQFMTDVGTSISGALPL